jgi:hypothetical protein
VEGLQPMFLLFVSVSWASLVILGLLMNPFVPTMCRSFDHSLLFNKKKAISPISKNSSFISTANIIIGVCV